MGVAFRLMEETTPDIETAFLTLVRELPDDFIVMDNTYSEMNLDTREGENLYGPTWSLLVFGPGIIVRILVECWAKLVKLEKKGQSHVLVYLDQDGQQWVTDSSALGAVAAEEYPSDTINRFLIRISSQSQYVSLKEVIDWISQSEVAQREDRRFFSKLKTEEATVLPFARHEWKSEIGAPFGHKRLYTLDKLVPWLRELSDENLFDDCAWTEERVRMFVEAVGSELRPSDWERIEKQVSRRALALEDAETISDQALQQEALETFPFPLAFSLRRSLTSHDPRIDYPEKLRCAENFLAYLGSLGIALARAADLTPGQYLNKELIECWGRGVSAGNWVGIIRETARALHILDNPEQLPVPEFPAIWWQPGSRKPRQGGLADTLEAIVKHRNQFHHGRGSATPSEIEKASQDLERRLLETTRGLRFLCGYPLWYVTDCAAQRGSPLHRISYKLCMGDNSEFEHRQADHDEFLARGFLYLRSDARLLDLTPWLTIRTCPKCGAEAMFFVERIDKKKGVAIFKSFERGHIAESEDHWDEIAGCLGL